MPTTSSTGWLRKEWTPSSRRRSAERPRESAQETFIGSAKLSPAAGVDAQGKPGQPWRDEVRQQVFEETAVDLGKGLQNWLRQRRARARSARRVGFPRFRKRGQHDAFGLHNQKNSIRVEPGAVCLPKIGRLRVLEGTQRLRRMLELRAGWPGRGARARRHGHPAARALGRALEHRGQRLPPRRGRGEAYAGHGWHRRWPARLRGHASNVASKQDETQNVCRGSGSGRACAAKSGSLKQKGALSVTPGKGAVDYARRIDRL